MRGTAKLQRLLGFAEGRDRRTAHRSKAPAEASAGLTRARPVCADLWKAQRCSFAAEKSVRGDSRYQCKGHVGPDTDRARIEAPSARVDRPTARSRPACKTACPTAEYPAPQRRRPRV